MNGDKSESVNRGLAADPQWYKDAVIYELRVRSFYDSGGDGIGDFRGLTERLEYLQRLGVTALWLLPFYPSPQRDDGYDISDYMNVHPECGTLDDFRTFLKEAHRRGLYVITELVLNHTSDQHPWFQRARGAASGSPNRDFYVWSDSSDRYRDARIIFRDSELSNWSWDPVAKAYYWHRFFGHQPDLNFDNPAVREAMLEVVNFWLEMGVDGLRLDAVPYLFEREGTSCENLPETHAYLAELRHHVDQHFPMRMLLAEANQWPEDAVPYLAEGKECHMAFHFPLMPRMFMAVRMEDRFPITDIWAQTPAIGDTCQWALFLRNHDELTLEMVTEEERDYMYRAYAQEARMRLNLGIRRRLAPLLGNNRRAIELNVGLLFSLPGTPVIYYGDEIGQGDNIFLGDRDGVRTPMQWSSDRNAGFSRANPQRLILPLIIDYEYHYQTVNVEAQESNQHSLLWWMRRIIAIRKQFKAFGRGKIEFLRPENAHVIAYIRRYEDERVLVVANLSRFVQYVELDLTEFKGMRPMELFGRNSFPLVGDLPYLLTLGPHMFLWFSIESDKAQESASRTACRIPQIVTLDSLPALFEPGFRSELELMVAHYLPHCRWFRSKASTIRTVKLADIIRLPNSGESFCILLVNVHFIDADTEMYVLPIAMEWGNPGKAVTENLSERVIAHVSDSGGRTGVLYDAAYDSELSLAFLGSIRGHRPLQCDAGEAWTTLSAWNRRLDDKSGQNYDPHVLRGEQSNTSIVFGDQLILKLFRRLDPGVNPDLEVGRFLTDREFTHAASIAGSIEYRSGQGEARTLGILQNFVANQGDAWQYTLHELRLYFERAAVQGEGTPNCPDEDLVDLLSSDGPDPQCRELIGPYLESAGLMGRRLAELHFVLASDYNDPEFAPEPFTSLYQRSACQSMRNRQASVMRQLNAHLTSLPDDLQISLRRLNSYQPQITACFEAFLKTRMTVVRMRTHGDLHLAQLLNTGNDFVIIDFEGEPALSLSERRRKRSALRDVAGMLRSFSYVAFAARKEQVDHGPLGVLDEGRLTAWAGIWETWASWSFLKGYTRAAAESPFLPESIDEMRVLLNAFQMEKAIYELGYELNNRPAWLRVPLAGIETLLGVRSGEVRNG